MYTAPADSDRIASVLADFNKTAGDFDAMSRRAMEQLSNGLMPRIRCAISFAGVACVPRSQEWCCGALGIARTHGLTFAANPYPPGP